MRICEDEYINNYDQDSILTWYNLLNEVCHLCQRSRKGQANPLYEDCKSIIDVKDKEKPLYERLQVVLDQI